MKLFGVLLTLVIAVMTLNGCDKPEKVKLPEPTQKGANTFGCYLNGRPIVITGKRPYSSVMSFTHEGVEFYHSNNTWHISASRDSPDSEFELEFTGTGVGTYTLNNATNFASYLLVIDYTPGGFSAITHQTDSLRTGQIVITNYVKDSFISGTFRFNAGNMDSVIHVTDGRFDIAE